jgi:hypothetical protein
MSQSVNICLNLYSLAVCDRADMPIVFVMIKFSYPQFVTQIDLKRTGSETKKN